jgi:hypothetical protein
MLSFWCFFAYSESNTAINVRIEVSHGMHTAVRAHQFLMRTGKQVLKQPQSSRNDIKLDHHHNQKGGTNESIVQWNLKGLRNNFEELKILTKELDPTIVWLQETNIKPEQQTWSGHLVFSKTVHAERAKHGVAILVQEGIKAKDSSLRRNFTRLQKVEQETQSKNRLKDDYEEEKKEERKKHEM